MIPTPEAIATAIAAMHAARRLSDTDRQMLICHRAAPGQSLTSRQMSQLMGWGGQYANLRYGKLGERLSDELQWVPTEREGYDGFTVSALILGSRPEAEFIWRLRPQISRALELIGWADPSDRFDVVVEDADAGQALTERRRYAWHCALERSSKAARLAKAAHGYECQACDLNFARRYGAIGEGFIEAHHLVPLSHLDPEEVRTYTADDFAVLCSNCHRMIHRMQDVGDVAALRALVESAGGLTV